MTLVSGHSLIRATRALEHAVITIGISVQLPHPPVTKDGLQLLLLLYNYFTS
jgi:hypothetical protein